MIYADSSALVKLVLTEAESRALKTYLDDHRGVPVVSCGLATVEVVRTIRLADPSRVSDALAVCADLDVIELSADLLDEARDLDPPLLRTLDAIHLAAASRIARVDLTAFVAYDDRLLDAARAAGLPTSSPGR